MSFGVRITARALRDISDARDWYDEQVSGLGQEFGVELERVLDHVSDEPLIYGAVYRHVRRALTRRFPYAIYFVFDDDRVTILRILQQARSPNELKR